MNYGLQHRYYTSVSNPMRLGFALGQDASPGSCLDSAMAPVDCGSTYCDPTMSGFINQTCTSQPPASLPGGGAAAGGGPTVPAGSVLTYYGEWEVTTYAAVSEGAIKTGGMSPQALVSAVMAQLPAHGLQVISQQVSGASTIASLVGAPQDFNVVLTIRVTASQGYNDPSYVQQWVDRLYANVTGSNPKSSSITMTPGGVTPAGMTPGGQPPQSMTQWFQQNAPMMGMLLVALVVLPAVVKKI